MPAEAKPPSSAGTDRALSAGLESLRAPAYDPAFDPIADPGGARHVLELDEATWLLRLVPELGSAAEAYGPVPQDPVWVRVERGSAELLTASLRSGADPTTRKAARVTVEHTERTCCATASCGKKKVYAAAWLVLEPHDQAPGRLLVAEALETTAIAARGRVAPVAWALARTIRAPHELDPDEVDADGGASAEGDPLVAADLARFSIRSEGNGVVLRDHGSDGPHARARRSLGVAAVLGVVAMGLWAVLGRLVQQDGSTGAMLGVGALAALVTLTAYAFFGVGRFGRRYAAGSSPLIWVGEGRITAMPWVARDGRVDLRAEGRFGASIPLAEVREVRVLRREKGFAVELDSEHGPIDLLLAASEPVARFWCAAIGRAMADAAHPEQKTSAKQRARARARGSS